MDKCSANKCKKNHNIFIWKLAKMLSLAKRCRIVHRKKIIFITTQYQWFTYIFSLIEFFEIYNLIWSIFVTLQRLFITVTFIKSQFPEPFSPFFYFFASTDFLYRKCKSSKQFCAFHCHCGLSQVAHLKDLVKESEENLDSAENHISCLKDSQEKLLIELDATRARVRETSNLLTDLQVKHYFHSIYHLQPI